MTKQAISSLVDRKVNDYLITNVHTVTLPENVLRGCFVENLMHNFGYTRLLTIAFGGVTFFLPIK